MTTVELKEELHSNTRRTRITYRALVDGQEVAIKCYRKPLFGLIHWLRAVRKGQKIRRAGGPVPPVVYSGWVSEQQCFGFGTAFLEGSRPLRDVLMHESAREHQMEVVRLLGRVMADIHRRGIEQPDGNLTNFLMKLDGSLAMVDEDDIRIHPGKLPLRVAVSNLGNVAARLPDDEMVDALLVAYLKMTFVEKKLQWDESAFWASVKRWRNTLEAKRASRNIDSREFD